MNVEQLILTIACGLTAAGFIATALAYMRLAPWYETPIGRWFVGQHIALGSIIGLLTINRAFNGEITRTVWVALVLTLAVCAWGTFVTVIRTQRHANPEHEETP